MEQYTMLEFSRGDKIPQKWLVEDDGNTIRKVQFLNDPYSSKNGDVVIYFDPSLRDRFKEQLDKVAEEYAVQKVIDDEFNERNQRWLQHQEVRCDD